jgi:hypothetical protein
VIIALVDDKWMCGAGIKRQCKPSPLGAKFLEALQDALASGAMTKYQNRKAVKVDVWKAECERRGLLDPRGKPDSARTLFNKHRRELIALNLIAGESELVWLR